MIYYVYSEEEEAFGACSFKTQQTGRKSGSAQIGVISFPILASFVVWMCIS